MEITDLTIIDYLRATGKDHILPPNASEDKNTPIIAPWNSENTPSCFIKESYFKDFSTGEKGGIIAFASLCVLGRIDMREGARELYRVFPHLSKNSYNSNYSNRQTTNYYRPHRDNKDKDKNENKTKIINVGHLYTYFLKDYITSRKIRVDIASRYVSEIKYEIKGKEYKAIGFKNDSDGYSLRNKYIKMNLGVSNISTIIENDVAYIVLNSVTHVAKGIREAKKYKTSVVFEGFMDFLSYKMISRKKPLENTCSLFLDNDISGDIATIEFQSKITKTKDFRYAYQQHSDLNSFIMQPKTEDFKSRDIVVYDAQDDIYRVFRDDKVIVETKYKTHIKKMMGELKNA